MIRYVGDGQSVNLGVPNRDLTEEEWEALTDNQRKIALQSGQFEVEKKAAKKAVKSKGGDG